MKKLLVNFIFFVFFLNILSPVKASINMTASVPDEISPDPPILIAPENGLYTNNQTPTFIFKKATDAQSPVRHYEMYLNDSLFIPEIPSSQTPVQNSQFSCFITQTTVSVSLKKPLKDGVYTWKIRAYDMYHNWIDSAKWTFTIDTQNPFLILSQVAENINLNFSSNDPNSIKPDLTLITFQRQPQFQGRSEPGATIQINLISTLTLRVSTLRVKVLQGKFTIAPRQKLKTGKYKIIVISADSAGNTTVLPDFYLEVKSKASHFSLPTKPKESLKKLQNLIQLPNATLNNLAIKNKLLFLIAICLLLWLITSKISYGFSWNLIFSFLAKTFLPFFLASRKKSLV